MLLSPRAIKSQNSIEKTQPGMMWVTFNGNPFTAIISCYNLTNVAIDYNGYHLPQQRVSSFARHIPEHNVLIICGDMNTLIGKDEY